MIGIVFSQTANTNYFDLSLSNNYDNIKTLYENTKINPLKLFNSKLIQINNPIVLSNYNNIKITQKYNHPNNIELLSNMENKHWFNNIKTYDTKDKQLITNHIITNNTNKNYKYNRNQINMYVNNDIDLSIIKDIAQYINQLSLKKKLRNIKILRSKNKNVKLKQANNKHTSITELIKQAESRKNIPSGLLRAIGMVESKLQPYVVNYRGRGYSFRNKNEATKFANGLIRRGETNFSVGCFQLHYKSHARKFSSVSAMFEPSQNIEYAAKLLNQLYRNNGYNWKNAVKRYHSNIDSCNNRYYSKIVIKLGRHL